MKIITKENINSILDKIKMFFKKHFDLFLVISLVLVISINLRDYIFIFKTNITIIWLSFPLLLIFIWAWFSNKLNKSHLLTSASIIFAVFVYLLSFAFNDDSKIKILSSMQIYNCSVTQDILDLKHKPEIWQGFVKRFFITQPYFDNASFLLQKLGTTTGIQLLNFVYEAQGANSLISQVQSLNVQGNNPLFGPFIKDSMKMYNEDLLNFVSSSDNIFCKPLF